MNVEKMAANTECMMFIIMRFHMEGGQKLHSIGILLFHTITEGTFQAQFYKRERNTGIETP